MPLAATKQPFLGFASSLKLKDDFATALALRGVSDRSLRFGQEISFLNFRFQQTALCHFKQRPESLHALFLARAIVPFLAPDAAATKALDYQQTVRNLQFLQTHRASSNSS